MSQAKVDRYKEEKKNREKLMKKQKRETMLLKLAGSVVAIALVGWIGFSVYQNVQADVANTYEVKTDALDDYLNGLNASEEETAEAETEASAETETTAEEAQSETAAE
ncbi:MAG: hypothetical protein ACI4CZ_10915 [Hominisplanchenecus sp.]